MPDETPTTQTQTETASPGAQATAAQPTQTGNLIDNIISQAFPDNKPLPATRKEAEKLGVQQAAAPATTPNEDDPPAEVKSDAGKANWKMLRSKAKERDELESKWKAAQTEIENYKKNPPKAEVKAPEDYELTKKERDELSERLKLLDIERHPNFQRAFEEKFNTVFTEAKEIGGQEHGDKIAQLLKLPDSQFKTEQLNEITKSLNPIQQAMLGAVMLEYKKVNNERASELTRAKENYAQFVNIQQEQQKRKQEQAKVQAEAAFNQELQSAMKDLPVFQKREGDEVWNKQVETMVQTARNTYSGNVGVADVARASLWAAAGPAIAQDAFAKGKEIETLKAEIARLKGSQPQPGKGTDPKEPDSLAGLSVVDRMVRQAQNSGLLIK